MVTDEGIIFGRNLCKTHTTQTCGKFMRLHTLHINADIVDTAAVSPAIADMIKCVCVGGGVKT